MRNNDLPLRLPRLAVLIAVLMLLSACAFGAGADEGTASQSASEPQSLTVSLYPSVPDTDRFEKALRDAWEGEHPDVELEFVEWNCYDEDLPDDLDVFVYDAIFLQTLEDQGALLPLEEKDVRAADDLLPFAYEAGKVDGQLYAVPQLLCTQLLYTREDDSLLGGVKSVDELHEALGDHTFEEVISSEGVGLLSEPMGTRSKACLYLQSLIDYQGHYDNEVGPAPAEGLTSPAVECLEQFRAMGASTKKSELAPEEDDPQIRPTYYPHARLFAKGTGRAYFGFSECMSGMGDYAERVSFRTLSMSGPDDIPVFYGDFASVNAQVDPNERDLAIDLLNMLTSADVLVSSSLPSEEDPCPQYLLLSRQSAYDALATEYPAYAKLKELVNAPDARLFLMTPNSKQSLEEYGTLIHSSGFE